MDANYYGNISNFPKYSNKSNNQSNGVNQSGSMNMPNNTSEQASNSNNNQDFANFMAYYNPAVYQTYFNQMSNQMMRVNKDNYQSYFATPYTLSNTSTSQPAAENFGNSVGTHNYNNPRYKMNNMGNNQGYRSNQFGQNFQHRNQQNWNQNQSQYGNAFFQQRQGNFRSNSGNDSFQQQRNFQQQMNQYNNHISNNGRWNNKNAYNHQHSIQNHENNSFLRKKRNHPELSTEEQVEISKWIESRKKQFPTAKVIETKKEKGKIEVEAGILSELELKLKEKNKLLSSINKRGNRLRFGGGISSSFGSNINSNSNYNRRRSNRRGKKSKGETACDGEKEEGEIQENENGEENNKEDHKDSILEKSNQKKKQSNTNNENDKIQKRQVPGREKGFTYRKNRIYEEIMKKDKIKELNVVLQAFRYFVEEGLV